MTERGTNLALFDLDHTLIPFDSGMAWTRFLAGQGVLPPEAPDAYLACCHQYVAGTLDIREMHRATVSALSACAPDDIERWARAFEREMAAQIPPAMREIVSRHRQAGDLCALVTATTSFIAEPFARLFDIPHVIATVPETKDGRLTGEVVGEPCHREHKISAVLSWLAGRALPGEGGLRGLERSWFYSDSANDLPLLQAVTHPVAVRPEPALRRHAVHAGWPVVD